MVTIKRKFPDFIGITINFDEILSNERNQFRFPTRKNAFYTIKESDYVLNLRMKKADRTLIKQRKYCSYIELHIDETLQKVSWKLSLKYAHNLPRQELCHMIGTFNSGTLKGWEYELIVLTKEQLLFKKEQRITPEERIKQIARETVQADKEKYSVSPNVDGNRRNSEWFAGSFAGK